MNLTSVCGLELNPDQLQASAERVHKDGVTACELDELRDRALDMCVLDDGMTEEELQHLYVIAFWCHEVGLRVRAIEEGEGARGQEARGQERQQTKGQRRKTQTQKVTVNSKGGAA